jgi:hypothetical protein
MSAHTCKTLNPDCYRCQLNIDEMRTITRRDYKTRTRLWGRCEGCREWWHWSGRTEDVASGMRVMWDACACTRTAP